MAKESLGTLSREVVARYGFTDQSMTSVVLSFKIYSSGISDLVPFIHFKGKTGKDCSMRTRVIGHKSDRSPMVDRPLFFDGHNIDSWSSNSAWLSRW